MNDSVTVDADKRFGIVKRLMLTKKKNLSTVTFVLPRFQTEYAKKSVDRLVALLKANRNIKNLECCFKYRPACHEYGEYLFEALANGHAGDNLQSIDCTGAWLSWAPVVFLETYLRRNQNLKQLSLALRQSPAALNLVSSIAETTVTQLKLDVRSLGWMPEIGRRLGQCSSILSLELNLSTLVGGHDEVASCLNGITNLRCLKRLQIGLGHTDITPLIVDTIASTVVQNKALEHFAICGGRGGANSACWLGLFLALSRSIKSLVLHVDMLQPLLHVLLSQLLCCESLALKLDSPHALSEAGSIISSLPKLRSIHIDLYRYNQEPDATLTELLGVIKASDSIAKAEFTLYNQWSPTEKLDFISIQHEIDSFCILNKVCGTNLIQFGATELWTRILPKIQDDSTKTTFLFWLLREKPELIVGRVQYVPSWQRRLAMFHRRLMGKRHRASSRCVCSDSI